MFSFKQGPIISVNLYLHTGNIQILGVCIRKVNKGINSYFTIRQIVDGFTVYHTYPLFSPFIKSIVLVNQVIPYSNRFFISCIRWMS